MQDTQGIMPAYKKSELLFSLTSEMKKMADIDMSMMIGDTTRQDNTQYLSMRS